MGLVSGSLLRVVILDMDDTLYNYEVCNNAGIEAVRKRIVKEFRIINNITDKEFDAEFQKARKSVKDILYGTAASHSRLLYFKELIENIAGKTNAKLSLELEELFWNEYMSKMKLYDGVIEFLEECKKRDSKVIIATNLTAQIQLKKVISLGLADCVDYIITSEEIGKEKPSPELIIKALKKAMCSAEEAVFIGDKDDFESAKKVNMRFVQVNSAEDWKDHRKILQMLQTSGYIP